MITTLFAAALVARGAQEAPVLSFHDGAFTVKTANASTTAGIKTPDAKKTEQVVFRKNDNFAVWDGRGLSIRHKNRTKSSRLNDIALTPKLFHRDQIIETRQLIADGVRQKEASGLSGARRIGSDAYFLVRWNETGGKPWLEALVKVDLDSENPTPQLVGKFDGISLANKSIDDCLFTIGDSVCALTRADGSWNLAKYNLTEKTFSAYVQGLDLVSYTPLSHQLGVFVEKASDGAYVVGRVDLVTGSRRNLLETRKKPTILDGVRPSMAMLEGGMIHNLESGAQTPVPSGSRALRTPKGVIVYWPSSQPKKAVLLDPERWTQLAKWDINQKPPVAPKPKAAAKKAATKKKAALAEVKKPLTKKKGEAKKKAIAKAKAEPKAQTEPAVKKAVKKPVKKTPKEVAKMPVPKVEVTAQKTAKKPVKKPVKPVAKDKATS